MTLLVDEDGQGEAGALHPPRGEPELIPDREEASEHLEAVAAARLLEDGDLVQIGGDGGGPATSTAAWTTWGNVRISPSVQGQWSLTDAGVAVPGSMLRMAHIPQHNPALVVHLIMQC